ncbi:MAG: hypothetical protein M3R13_00940 [Armatimonadota bacterium]|nr:hypothetical protein [Armatimonadota bacterium]
MLRFVYFVVGAALVGFSFLTQGATNPALKGHVAGLQAAQSLQAKFSGDIIIAHSDASMNAVVAEPLLWYPLRGFRSLRW